VGFNIVILSGRFAKDPEVRRTANGTQVSNFTLAVNESYKKDGKWQNKVEWVRCEAWGVVAKIVEERFQKGSFAEIKGCVRTYNWKDKRTNEIQYSTKVNVRNIDSAGQNKSFLDSENNEREENSESQTDSGSYDNVPF